MANVENALHSSIQEGNDVQAVSLGPPIEQAIIQTIYQTICSLHVLQSNPLGHEVTLMSSVTLNLGFMLGAGIYSVPGVVLNSVGSIGLLEYASMFPKRSGAQVVFLEQAYPHPRFFIPVTFAVTSVILSLKAANAIVFAQYALAICDVPITSAKQTAVALAVSTICFAGELSAFPAPSLPECDLELTVVGLSTKWSLRVVSFLAALKVLSLVFLIFTGALVLGGFTHIRDPSANFRSPFSSSTTNLNSLATALVKTNWAFSGWHNAFNVLGEVHTPDPVRTVRKAGFISLLLTTFLFFFVNVAYVAAVPKDEISSSGPLIAALFFQHVFGKGFTAQILPIMVALSCFGTIIAGTVGQARMLREVARQGLLPYANFFVSTKPFGTPLAPVGLKYLLTVFAIVSIPAQDAFNFLVDLASYPTLVFHGATAIGLWLLRRRRNLASLAPSKYRARNLFISSYFLSTLFLLVMPWVPPEPGHSDVSFWYATYCVAGLSVLALCGVYYWMWIVFLPWLGGYTIVEEVEHLEDGALTTRLKRKHYPAQVEIVVRRNKISDTAQGLSDVVAHISISLEFPLPLACSSTKKRVSASECRRKPFRHGWHTEAESILEELSRLTFLALATTMSGPAYCSPTDDFDARPPFSGLQDDNVRPVISLRPLQEASRPRVLRSQLSTPFCPPANLLKRKRQRDSNNYPSALHSESGDSITRRPRKRRILYLAPSSGEELSDMATTEAYDSAAIKHNHNDVITTNICADTHPSAPCCLAPPSKTMSNYTSKVLSVHKSPRNDQGHKKAVGLTRAYECALTYPLIVNNDSPSVCLKDSSPVPAIDFTRMRFPSRNRWRFPLLRLEPASAKAEGKEGGEGSVRSASSHCTLFVCLHRMYLQLHNF
ncbi:hypothetical protein AZE42_10367 [Rhizopogon vesiculosus]|uniref:Uncharacterized protein n=1 Tax=Rhizopogon vesiculosus TaxID=180088 RepID=A0A1J8QGN3_9AGAM|nr:hypothetical protein AZE42_10367 [Rhizopogon vesiculosus]